MRALVQFGAGNIGRGFIAALAAQSGWRVRFVDVDRARIAELNRRRSYRVIEVTNESRTERVVREVEGIDGGDAEAVAEAVAGADLVATAVGLGVLPRLAAPIAEGWRRRRARGGGNLDVLVCENGARATDILREALEAAVPAAERAAIRGTLGVVRTSIGRMIPPTPSEIDALDIAVEPYCHLPVERAAFTAALPAIEHLEARDDFDLVLMQKLYLHNLTHACLAYGGAERGLATIPDCAADAVLAARARAAGDEAAEAISRACARDGAPMERIRAENRALLDSLFARYRNRALADPVRRVARDPMRKLAPDDRLVGAAQLCLAHGVAPRALCGQILTACRYRCAPDEPDAARWNAAVSRSPLDAFMLATQFTPQEPIMAAVTSAAQRASAASAIRDAGLVLTDAEAQALEIADFGLNRFAQFGLAIHVYVNTDRCCAKELVMLPGQICPEHRHPPIPEAKEPGKEETFRVRKGHVSLFLPGAADATMRAAALALLPADKRSTVTVYRRVDLGPGAQCTLPPDTPHWFAAGPEGAVVSEFSTKSRDDADIFTDHAIKRVPDAQ